MRASVLFQRSNGRVRAFMRLQLSRLRTSMPLNWRGCEASVRLFVTHEVRALLGMGVTLPGIFPAWPGARVRALGARFFQMESFVVIARRIYPVNTIFPIWAKPAKRNQ